MRDPPHLVTLRGVHAAGLIKNHVAREKQRLDAAFEYLKNLEEKCKSPDLPTYIENLCKHEPEMKNGEFWRQLAFFIDYEPFSSEQSPLFRGFEVYGRTDATDLWPNAKEPDKDEKAHLDRFEQLHKPEKVQAPPEAPDYYPTPFESDDLTRDDWACWRTRLPVGARLEPLDKQPDTLTSFSVYSGFRKDADTGKSGKIRLICSDKDRNAWSPIPEHIALLPHAHTLALTSIAANGAEEVRQSTARMLQSEKWEK